LASLGGLKEEEVFLWKGEEKGKEKFRMISGLRISMGGGIQRWGDYEKECNIGRVKEEGEGLTHTTKKGKKSYAIAQQTNHTEPIKRGGGKMGTGGTGRVRQVTL